MNIERQDNFETSLAFLPGLLEPRLQEARQNFKKEIPKGWVLLAWHESGEEKHIPYHPKFPLATHNRLVVTTVFNIVRAPRIVCKLRYHEKENRGPCKGY